MKKTDANAGVLDSAVIQRLKEKPISKIVLIDDAHDLIDSFSPESVDAQFVETFFETLNNKKAPGFELKSAEFELFRQNHLDKNIRSVDDIDDDVLTKLWEHRENFNHLRTDLETLFGVDLGKLRQFTRICDQLKLECTDAEGNELVSIKSFGTKVAENLDELKDSRVILLDYILGDENKPAAAKDAAAKVAEKLYNSEDEEAPLVILMSSQSSVLKIQDEFQEKTSLLKGLFYCVTKDDLIDLNKLRLNILAWIDRLDKGMVIHRFTLAADLALKKATTELSASIRNLSLEDYAYVSDSSLRTEGQPLGEYMLWLFNSHLGRIAFELDEGVAAQRAAMDKISFVNLPVKHLMPSHDLAEMYDSALFIRGKNLSLTNRSGVKGKDFPDDISKIRGIAFGANLEKVNLSKDDKGDGAEASEEAGLDFPVLRLGLLFYKDNSSPVMMVLNADCDLVFTDDGGRNPSSIITFIPGHLLESSSSEKLAEHDTEFFTVGEKVFHIKWDLKNGSYIEYPSFGEYVKKSGYSPVAILKSPYVLKVQQEYAATIARIGLPVPPPIQHKVGVEFYCKDPITGVRKKLGGPFPDIAFLIKGRKDKPFMQLRLTIHFLTQLLDQASSFKKILEESKADISKPDAEVPGDEKAKEVGQVAKTAKQIENIIRDLDSKLPAIAYSMALNQTPLSFKGTGGYERVNNDPILSASLKADETSFLKWEKEKQTQLLINIVSLEKEPITA